MPYKFEYDKSSKFKLDEADGRRKVSEDMRELIKKYFEEGFAQRWIARETKVSRRMISFILFPERLKACKEQFKERRKDGRYYDKETNTKAVAAYRKKKFKIFKEKEKRMNESLKITIEALENMRGDDLQAAKWTFKHCTPQEMQEQYGKSGKTRAEILEKYTEHDRKITEAIRWVRSLCSK